MEHNNKTFYEKTEDILAMTPLRKFVNVITHGGTHFLFFLFMAIVIMYLWRMNNDVQITPHNLGIHIDWKSNIAYGDIKGYSGKDTIKDVAVHIMLNSDKIYKNTKGKYKNGIRIEFRGITAKAVKDTSKPKLFVDSLIFALYCEPKIKKFDVYATYDPFVGLKVDYNSQDTTYSYFTYSDTIIDGLEKTVASPIAVKNFPPDYDFKLPCDTSSNNEGMTRLSILPTDYSPYIKVKTRNEVWLCSESIGNNDNAPYYYYYFNVPPAPRAEFSSIDFQFSDTIEKEEYGLVYTKGKNMQYKYIYPEPDLIGNGRVVYNSKEKMEEIIRNKGVVIQAVDVDALNDQNNSAFLYTVLIGTCAAFLLDIIIQLIRELRRLQKRKDEQKIEES